MIKSPKPKISPTGKLIKDLSLIKMIDKSDLAAYNDLFIGDGLLNIERSVMPELCYLNECNPIYTL